MYQFLAGTDLTSKEELGILGRYFSSELPEGLQIAFSDALRS